MSNGRWWHLAVSLAAGLATVAGACGGGSGKSPDAGQNPDVGLPDGGPDALPDGGGIDGAGGGYVLPDPAPPGVTYDGKVVVSPAAVLFVNAGETAQLTAAAFDASGGPVSGAVTWTSSRPGEVTIDASGVVTSVMAVGSAQITAQIGSRVSAPVTVLVVAAYPGTELVTDAQVVSGPDLVDPAAPVVPGVQLTTTIAGAPAFEPGSFLVGKEGKPLAGRVVSATPDGAGNQVVVLETVALLDLFARMSIHTEDVIDEAALVALEHARQAPPSSLTDDPSFGLTQSALTSRIGPFICDVSAGNTGLLTLDASARVVPSLSVVHDFIKDDEGDWSLIDLEVKGSVTATGRAGVKLAPGVMIEATCSLLLFEIPIPVSGPLALFASAEVPVGLAGKLKAAVTAGNVELGMDLTSTGSLDQGFRYTKAAGLELIDQKDVDFHMKPRYTLPTMVPVKAKIEASLGAFTGLDFRLLTSTASLLRVLFLGKAAGDFALVDTQLDDTSYASKYSIVPVIEVGPGNDAARALSWFGGLLRVRPAASFELTDLAAKSPAGTLSSAKSRAHPGDDVAIKVTLDEKTLQFYGFDNVEEVIIHGSDPNSSGGRQIETTLEAFPGKTVFDWTWHASTEDLGVKKLWATVVTRLVPGFELEIADNTTLPIFVTQPGWGGTLQWSMTGSSNGSSGKATDTWTTSGDGMMTLTPGMGGIPSLDTVSASYHYDHTQVVNNAYMDGTCMHTVRQTSEETLSGTTAIPSVATFSVGDLGGGSVTIIAGLPAAPASGLRTIDATETTAGTGLNCSALPPSHTESPNSGAMPGDNFMFTGTKDAMGSVQGMGMMHFDGQPPRDYTVTWNLSQQ